MQRVSAALCVTALTGCFEPVPELGPYPWTRREGERVVLTTDVEMPLCAGTIAKLDRHVIEIEAALELEPRSVPIDVWMLSDEAFDSVCPPSGGCARKEHAFVPLWGYGSTRHELAHVIGVYGNSFFGEGLATALGETPSNRNPPDITPAILDEMLESNWLMSVNGYGYGAAGDFVHWMLENFGPAPVLAFMSALRGSMTAAEVRALYLEHFARDLEADFHAAQRQPGASFSLAHMNCDAPLAPRTEDGRGVILQASLDCESPQVQNYVTSYRTEPGVDPPEGFVEWTFEVPPAHAGYHEVHGGTSAYLQIERCGAALNYIHERTELGPTAWDFDVVNGQIVGDEDEQILLESGLYRVRWTDLLDEDTVLDVTLTAACDYAAQDCPDGEQCTIWRRCEPAPKNPAALGENCNLSGQGNDPCEFGSRCIEGVCLADCDAEHPCADGLGCSQGRSCAPICELAAQDCGAAQLACVPSSEAQLGSNGLGVCVAAGNGEDFDSCDRLGSECAMGWSCEWLEGWFDDLGCDPGVEEGCCTRLCDPAANGSDCPADASVCDPVADGPTGICRPSSWTDEL
jgi:hypothetical protein